MNVRVIYKRISNRLASTTGTNLKEGDLSLIIYLLTKEGIIK